MPSSKTTHEWRNGPTPRFVQRYQNSARAGISRVAFVTGLGFTVKVAHDGNVGVHDFDRGYRSYVGDITRLDWRKVHSRVRDRGWGDQNAEEWSAYQGFDAKTRKLVAPITFHNGIVSVMPTLEPSPREFAKLRDMMDEPIPPGTKAATIRRAQRLQTILESFGDMHDGNVGFDTYKRPYVIDYGL